MDVVVIGVDPHKRSVTIEARDAREVLRATGSFPTTTAGYRAMLQVARQSPADDRAGRRWDAGEESVPQYQAMLAGVRPRDVVGRTVRRLAADQLADLVRLDARLKALKAELTQAVLATGSQLMDLPGVGPAGAARILADVGDVARFPRPQPLHVLDRHRPDRRLLRRPDPPPALPRRQPPDEPRACWCRGWWCRRPGNQRGASGAWAQLFARCAGYLGTEPFWAVKRPGRYLTVDRFSSAEARHRFLGEHGTAYAELDARYEEPTEWRQTYSAEPPPLEVADGHSPAVPSADSGV